MKTILYSQESGIALPLVLHEKYNIITAKTPSDAKKIIKEKGDSIDAFIVGMVMIKDDKLSESVELEYKWMELNYRFLKANSYDVRVGMAKAMRQVERKQEELLELDGGLQVLEYIDESPYASKAVLLFIPHNHIIRSMAEVYVGDKKTKKILSDPGNAELVLEWVAKQTA